MEAQAQAQGLDDFESDQFNVNTWLNKTFASTFMVQEVNRANRLNSKD